jgi:hypothetical protein
MVAIAVILIILAVIIGGFLFIAGLISGLNGEDWRTEEEKKKESPIHKDIFENMPENIYNQYSVDLTANYLRDNWD